MGAALRRIYWLNSDVQARPWTGAAPPQPEFLAWHRAEVFKEPARE
jgi:hypothetical protein